MPDHLKLAVPALTASKRRPPGGGQDKDTFDRANHATTLRGLLAGLESNGLALFTKIESPSSGSEDELTELGTVVLKFSTKGRPKASPLSKLNMTALGENAENEFFVLAPENSRNAFAELLATYEQAVLSPSLWTKPEAWRDLIDQITGVDLYGPEDRYDFSLEQLSFDAPEAVDIVLWPTSLLRNSSASRSALERTEAISKLLLDSDPTASILSVNERPDTPVVRAVVSKQALQLVLEHPFVERVRGPLQPFLSPTELIGAVNRKPVPAPEGEAIGIIDDLVVVANPLMAQVVKASASFPTGRVFGGATGHGTLVASIAAYGSLEEVARGGDIPTPFPIYSARIAEAAANRNPVVVDDVLAQFERAMTWIAERGARIVVISYTYNSPDIQALPSELTTTIDRLARDLQLVVVVSAGNATSIGDRHWAKDYPEYLKDQDRRVAAPGTSALALTVGAIASRSEAFDRTLVAIASPGGPAPFTRLGPTRGNRDGQTRKPELVGPGGNWAMRNDSATPVPADPSLAVIGASGAATPLFTASWGTSLAAPFVAHEVAKIATRYPDAGPNLLRALTALSTPPLTAQANPDLKPSLVSAYGIPNAERILESGGNRVVLIYEGSIPIGGRHIHRVPLPDEFVRLVPGAERQIRIALAFDPPVKKSRRDYVAGRMAFHFVRNMTFEDVKRTWEIQPTLAERDRPKNPAAFDELPKNNSYERPNTIPGVQSLSSNTLVRRDVNTTQWSVDDADYFLVVTHDNSPWTGAQLAENPEQTYSIAIEVVDEGRTSLDLFGLIEAQLPNRAKGRQRV